MINFGPVWRGFSDPFAMAPPPILARTLPNVLYEKPFLVEKIKEPKLNLEKPRLQLLQNLDRCPSPYRI